MIRIAITAEAFAAIEATLPLGTVAVEPKANEKGEREIWLEPHIVDKLKAPRGPGEDFSDVILRLAPARPHRSPRNPPSEATRQNRRSVMKSAPIWVTITALSGVLMMFAGMMYYTFIGPHPDASGSINENVLNSLFWSDHPGLSLIVVGLMLVIVAYIGLSRADRSSS